MLITAIDFSTLQIPAPIQMPKTVSLSQLQQDVVSKVGEANAAIARANASIQTLVEANAAIVALVEASKTTVEEETKTPDETETTPETLVN